MSSKYLKHRKNKPLSELSSASCERSTQQVSQISFRTRTHYFSVQGQDCATRHQEGENQGKKLEKWMSVGKSVNGIIGKAEFVLDQTIFIRDDVSLYVFTVFPDPRNHLRRGVCLFLKTKRCLHTDLVTGIPLYSSQ
jgi:hypothetical protein